jgi:hypothetical protein
MSLSAFKNIPSKPRENLRFDSALKNSAPQTTSNNDNTTTRVFEKSQSSSSTYESSLPLKDTVNRNNYNSLVNGDGGHDSDVSLMSSNNLLLQHMKQQDQKYNNYKHYEKYLQMSPRINSSTLSPTSYNSHDISSSNIDELLKDFRKELSQVGSLNDDNDDNILEKKSFLDLTPNRYSVKRNDDTLDDQDYSIDSYLANRRTLENGKDSKNYLSKNGEGLLKDLDLSMDKNIMHTYDHFEDDPTSPIAKRFASTTKGVSPSPFTRLKHADTKEFLMSPITHQKTPGISSYSKFSKSTSSAFEDEPASVSFAKRQSKYDYDYDSNLTGKNLIDYKTKSDGLFDHEDDSINLNNTKSQISSSVEAALRLENIQLRNEVSKLSAAVVGMQTRMKDLESHVDQILRLVMSQKK